MGFRYWKSVEANETTDNHKAKEKSISGRCTSGCFKAGKKDSSIDTLPFFALAARNLQILSVNLDVTLTIASGSFFPKA